MSLVQKPLREVLASYDKTIEKQGGNQREELKIMRNVNLGI
jgi:hypothetical protein